MAVATTDNRIYIIGGFDGFNYLNTVEVYNPSIGEFDNSVAFPAISEAKSGAGAVVIGNKLYVIGGYTAQDTVIRLKCVTYLRTSLSGLLNQKLQTG